MPFISHWETKQNNSENDQSTSGRLALSSTQEGIWFDQTLNPDSLSYNQSSLVRIDGKMDESLFTQAFEAMVSHHDALRLRLINADGLPLQTLIDTQSVCVTRHDFSQYDDAEAQIKQHIHTSYTQAFDLHGDLWRCELLKVSDTRWYWQFCWHHLILDGWGITLVINELADNYTRLSQGKALAQSAPSYVDFILDDRTYLNSKRYASDRRFWQEGYSNLPPALLPVSNQSKTINTGQTGTVIWQLDKTLFQRIEDAAATHSLSVLHFMYAVLACYFTRTADTQEIVIGIPVHNRKKRQTKAYYGYILIGYSDKTEHYAPRHFC